jgi:thiol:disulfide interchange protein DsbD
MGALMCEYGFTQSSPVQWDFVAKPVDGNTYELQITATVKEGWYIYSQDLPADAINVPTSFSFVNGSVKGRLKEEGKLEKSKDESLQIESWYFKNKVVFKGLVEVKALKENINGSVEFQACTGEKCLTPARINFSVAINR